MICIRNSVDIGWFLVCHAVYHLLVFVRVLLFIFLSKWNQKLPPTNLFSEV
jgi:hypothetical protein